MSTADQTKVRPPSGASRERLHQLAGHVRELYATLRYVDYHRAERDVERLAEKIQRDYSAEEISELSFTAIPRGGLIVLGMLSYQLSLKPTQLRPARDRGRPLMVIDDCALTGARFATELAATPSSRVDFAHLYSHPRLRRAIVATESRVKHCLAARDLADHSRRFFPDAEAHRAWKKRWQDRLGSGRYWYGVPDLICFAWSEPDRLFWNSATGQVENGWRFLPPHRCSKHRAELARPGRGPGRWRVPTGVVIGDFDGEIWLCNTQTEQVYSLEGVAADMWRLVVGGAGTGAAAELAETYRVKEDAVLRDLTGFVDQLASLGLVAEGPRAPSSRRLDGSGT